MAREVAVDVASHTPQVEPILDELAGMLDDITPLAPHIPYYSATLFDPREQPHCDVDYWVDNLRHTVRFSAAAQAALEDGFRVFAELAPHPLLVRAIDQTAATLDILLLDEDMPEPAWPRLARSVDAAIVIDAGAADTGEPGGLVTRVARLRALGAPVLGTSADVSAWLGRIDRASATPPRLATANLS